LALILTPLHRGQCQDAPSRVGCIRALPWLPKGGRASSRAQLSQGEHRHFARTDPQFFWIRARQEPRPPEEKCGRSAKVRPPASHFPIATGAWRRYQGSVPIQEPVAPMQRCCRILSESRCRAWSVAGGHAPKLQVEAAFSLLELLITLALILIMMVMLY